MKLWCPFFIYWTLFLHVIHLNGILPLGHGWLISLQDLISRVQNLARWERCDYTTAFAYAGILQCTYCNLDSRFCRDTVANQAHLTLVPCAYSSNKSSSNTCDSSLRLSVGKKCRASSDLWSFATYLLLLLQKCVVLETHHSRVSLALCLRLPLKNWVENTQLLLSALPLVEPISVEMIFVL